MIEKNKKCFEGHLATILLTILFLLITLQIISRNIMANPPTWSEELSRWTWVWLCFIGLGEVSYSNSHLKMDILITKVNNNIKKIIKLTTNVIYLIITLILLYYGVITVLKTLHSNSITLPVSTAWLFASYPVGASIVIFRILQGSIQIIRDT